MRPADNRKENSWTMSMGSCRIPRRVGKVGGFVEGQRRCSWLKLVQKSQIKGFMTLLLFLTHLPPAIIAVAAQRVVNRCWA